MTENFRAEAIAKALEVYKVNGLIRTETIEYRGVATNLEVVTISPEIPLLNPGNSRLRGQLLEHPQYISVTTDPYLPESQKILANLLSSTEKFGELKKQIEDWKQQEPGIISRDGLLVNGNTRLTAIRQLGLHGFDVAVLPEDATGDDFFAIEMSLQLRKLVHQDYTFTNVLLLVDNYLKRTGNEQATINAMQWKRDGKKKLRLYLGYLTLVDEIRKMNPRLKYEFFDNRAEFIRNLHDEVANLPASDAEKLKNTRIMGLFLGLNKDEIRETDEFFLDECILPNVEGDELEQLFATYMGGSSVEDPLDHLIDGSTKPTIDLKKLVVDIANKVIDEQGSVNDGLVEQHFKKLHSKVRSSARQKREDRINLALRTEPIEYLKDVTTRVQELADRIPIFSKDPKFDYSKFEFQAKKTSKAVAALQDALRRALDG